MITRILCPVDFSEASCHAIEHATAIAGWYKASLTALHVYDPMFMPIPGLPAPDDRVPEAEIARIAGRVAACFETATAAGLKVNVLVDAGRPALHILKRAATLPADLIVMGTHGASGFEHLILGSVTENVLRKASCAVLTVPPHANATSKLPFKQLLCAVDFSEWSLRALDFACSLARESGAQLTALAVIEWPWEEPPAPVSAELPAEQAAQLSGYRRYLETSAMGRLSTLVEEATASHVAVAPRISHGKPYVEILRTAADVSADLIVMGVHGRRAIDVMVFGSTTNHVVRQATCPVLTLRDGT